MLNAIHQPERAVDEPESTKQQQASIPLTKNNRRREEYRRLGAGLREYATGLDCQFDIKCKRVFDELVSSRREGPEMKTQQWERTVRK